MTRVVSGLIYYFIYSIIYLSPLMVLMLIEKSYNLHFAEYLERLGPFRIIIGIIVLSYVFLLPGYRAKLASDAYGERDMKFWEAHSVSGVILKSHLSFLPVIGKLFNR